MYRFKHQGKPYEYLVDDANLIIELRNGAIENEVTWKMDGWKTLSWRLLQSTLSPACGIDPVDEG
jgi:hypothetical protein